MPAIKCNGVRLEYDIRGEGPPVVLIMGLNSQLVHWPEEFCDALAACGLTVIRFDNRDTGLSSTIDQAGKPDVKRMMVRRYLGLPVSAPYTLSDMAVDVVHLVEGLGFLQAHIVGISMGGMIAQTMAIEHPTRVASLVSLMSTPGDRRFLPRPEALKALLKRPARGVDGFVEHMVGVLEVLNGEGFPFNEEGVRDLAALAFQRGVHPAGFARQMAAILASGSRRPFLSRVQAPTLVIHGESDPLIPAAAGRATARAIPDAELELIPRLGHALPMDIWPRLIDSLAGHVWQNSPGWHGSRLVSGSIRPCSRSTRRAPRRSTTGAMQSV